MPTPDELLEQLEDDPNVPQATVDALKDSIRTELDASKLRQKVGELEARWREQAEPAIQKIQQYETQPKRIEALSKAGIDYNAVPIYAKEVLDSIPADKLGDETFVADFVSSKGFEATPQAGPQQALPNAAAIVSQTTSAPATTTHPADRAALFAAASSAEEVARLAAENPPE